MKRILFLAFTIAACIAAHSQDNKLDFHLIYFNRFDSLETNRDSVIYARYYAFDKNENQYAIAALHTALL